MAPSAIITWSGGAARYVYVLQAGSANPTVPLDCDTPLLDAVASEMKKILVWGKTDSIILFVLVSLTARLPALLACGAGEPPARVLLAKNYLWKRSFPMNRRSTLATVLALACLPLIAAKSDCGGQTSDAVAQDGIYTGYWLYYDANTDQTYARAQFRFGNALGTTLELTAPAAVSFAGKPLSWNPLLVWHETTLAGKVASGTYNYINTAGLRLENPVQILRSIDLPGNFPSTLARSQSFTLTWVGEPIAQDEDLEVVLANQQDPLKFVRFDQINKGSTDLVLSAAQLNQLPAGATSVALRRHQNGVPAAAPRGGWTDPGNLRSQAAHHRAAVGGGGMRPRRCGLTGSEESPSIGHGKVPPATQRHSQTGAAAADAQSAHARAAPSDNAVHLA